MLRQIRVRMSECFWLKPSWSCHDFPVQNCACCSSLINHVGLASLSYILGGFVFGWRILAIPLNPCVPSFALATSPPNPQKVPAAPPTVPKVPRTFPSTPAKQQDFPGNVSSGGCDSLPTVLALTSKQHDSRLCYALHFLYIISLRMCRCGKEWAGTKGNRDLGSLARAGT